jgi:hypothetical protein
VAVATRPAVAEPAVAVEQVFQEQPTLEVAAVVA